MESVNRVSVKWLPEDDLLLRNAVEDGASLEALARGAVQFSQRYPLKELRERWYSLLYDDDISTQSSVHMFELEISGTIPASKYRPGSNSLRNKDAEKKRKFDSVRRKYYSLRKRFFTEYPNILESNPCTIGEHAAGFQGQGIPDGDHLAHIDLGLEEEDLEFLRQAFPEAVGDVSMASDAANAAQSVHRDIYEEVHRNGIIGGFGFSENHASPSREAGTNISDVIAKSSIYVRHEENSKNCLVEADVEVNMGVYGESDSLINLPSEVVSMLLDFDNKTEQGNCSSIVIDSVPGDLISDIPEAAIVKDDCPDQEVSEDSLMLDPTINPLDMETSGSSHEEVANHHFDDDLPAKKKLNSEFADGIICCALNTEDLEIPCNDDIFLLIHPTSPSCSCETQQDVAKPDASLSSLVEEDHRVAFNLQSKDPTRPSRWPWKEVTHGLAEPASRAGKIKSLIPDFQKRALGDPSNGRPQYTTSTVADKILAKKEVHGLDMKTETAAMRMTEAGKKLIAESVYDSPVSELEDSEMDDDVPYFSDVESLILEMDLDPTDHDLHINRKVPSYQYEETKRTIIRLEQGARSCLQRDMTSRGAFAILYGRHLKYYITKTQVLLGRSTEDNAVDIDLAIEGCANKISRRQAVIKMEEDGCFVMKNLGRSSMSLNGFTVVSGQLVNLCSSCLIEIKGMSFVFEMNERLVKKQVVVKKQGHRASDRAG